MYYRAKAYQYLSWRDESYRRRAIDAFEGFLQASRGIASEAIAARKEDAALALFTMTASSLPEARAAFEATNTLVPNSRRQHEMLLRLGLLQEQADSNTAGFGHLYGDHSEEPRVCLGRRGALPENAAA